MPSNPSLRDNVDAPLGHVCYAYPALATRAVCTRAGRSYVAVTYAAPSGSIGTDPTRVTLKTTSLYFGRRSLSA